MSSFYLFFAERYKADVVLHNQSFQTQYSFQNAPTPTRVGCYLNVHVTTRKASKHLNVRRFECEHH